MTTSTEVRTLDPLTDPRWDEFVQTHRLASVFHSRAWLEALKRTYGYEPLAVTTSADAPLKNGLVLCRVNTGVARRLVSLPFSDHCDPLVDNVDDLSPLLNHLMMERSAGLWRSLELRPRMIEPDGLDKAGVYCLHRLDISRPAEAVYRAFHRSSVQQTIRRAERESLQYEVGASDGLLLGFYRLLRMTRRRHGLPPQPFAWFKNLAACLGDRLSIHLASKNGEPVAGILTMTFRKTLVYKYGGSDARHHRLGGMQAVFWRAIQAAQAQGLEEFDLGRSDLDQPGLLAFKDHLGATRTTLTYYACPKGRARAALDGHLARAARRLLPHLPDATLDLIGRLLYRHLG